MSEISRQKPQQRTVLLGVDASEHSRRAFNWYVNNVHQERDMVLIIHAHEIQIDLLTTGYPVPYGVEFYEHVQTTSRASEQEWRCLLESYGKRCEQHKLNFKLLSEVGKPGETICKVAKKVNVDLIVMGARGHGKLRRTLMGSVSGYCVHHAHVPVAVVPPPCHLEKVHCQQHQ